MKLSWAYTPLRDENTPLHDENTPLRDENTHLRNEKALLRDWGIPWKDAGTLPPAHYRLPPAIFKLTRTFRFRESLSRFRTSSCASSLALHMCCRERKGRGEGRVLRIERKRSEGRNMDGGVRRGRVMGGGRVRERALPNH